MQTMNTLSAGFWGSYFCVVALVMVGAVAATGYLVIDRKSVV